MRGLRRAAGILLLFGVCWMSGMIGCGSSQSKDVEFVRGMGAGWNLGNSLESVCGDGTVSGLELETYWQNPKTTGEMLREVYDAGFRTVRIPVAWEPHMDESGKIDSQWMNRVREVVDDALGQGFYVILNSHHDTFYTPSVENEAYAVRMMANVWGQIAESFRDYDTKLLFEGMNEPRLIGASTEWGGESAENDRIVERLNQTFVDTVRAAGGYHEERYLLVTPYAGMVEALDGFEMPEGERLILTVHAYKPYSFAMDEAGDAVWELQGEKEIDGFMETLKEQYTDRGIPVIIGEFGAIDKNNTGEREKWLQYYTDKAKECGISCLWWDEGGAAGETYGRYRIFDRENRVWLFESLKDILISQ